MSLHISIVPHVPLSLGQGGLEIQQERTITSLQESGLQVSRFDAWAPTFDADILHVFGSSHHQAEIVFRASARGIPVVVTSMFVRTHSPTSYAMGKMADQVGLRTLFSVRRQILEAASRVIAISAVEKEDLVDVFDVDPEKIDVIPNGVDQRFFDAQPELFQRHTGLSDILLCVASVEPNKNQLTLINAIEHLNLPLVLIGPPKEYAVGKVKSYVDTVRQRCEDSAHTTWLSEGLDHDDPLLASAFAAAKVHVLPSHAEAQGIVNLEAAAAGASLVMSDLPTLRSTFGDDVWYADTTSPDRLANVITAAWETPRGDRYSSYPERRPPWLRSWTDIAGLLAASYNRLVGQR